MRILTPLLLLAAAAIHAQTPQPSQPFRSGVQIVEVDARVFDKEGRFVGDLTRDDFELLEDGVPQRVVSILLVGEPGSGVQPDPGSRIPDPGPRTPDPGPRPSARQTWVFFFDLNHLTPGAGFDRAKKAVEDFLRDKWKDGDLAGIVAGSKMVNNRMTSVREELVNAAKNVKPLNERRGRIRELTQQWPRLINEDEAIRIGTGNSAAELLQNEVLRRATDRACEEEPAACKNGRESVATLIIEKVRLFIQEDQRATLETMSAVNALASGLAKMPGPKTIVLLTDGFIVERLETTLRSVVGQTARAGARIYAIDVRGLNRRPGAGDIEKGTFLDDAGFLSPFDLNEDGPNSLAVDTGGLMIRNENNIGRALERVAQDSGRYYVLAYAPDNTNFDGKFRKIDVRVKRPDVRVRARRGYLALEPAKMLIPRAITDAGAKSPDAGAKSPDAGAKSPGLRTETSEAPPSYVGRGSQPRQEEPEAPATTAAGIVVAPAAGDAKTTRLRPDADKVVEALAALSKQQATAAAHRGWDAYQRGDVESAVKLLGQAAEGTDARPWVLYALGLSHAALGRHAEAAESWERVRQGAPDFAPVYSDLADIYLQLSDSTRALAVLREAEKRWPTDTDILNAIGVVHARRGALDEAVASFRKAAEAAPDNAMTFFNLGKAYELKYTRSMRYVDSQRIWVSSEEDRKQAEVHYQQCIKLGGPYAEQAATALSNLSWAKK